MLLLKAHLVQSLFLPRKSVFLVQFSLAGFFKMEWSFPTVFLTLGILKKSTLKVFHAFILILNARKSKELNYSHASILRASLRAVTTVAK